MHRLLRIFLAVLTITWLAGASLANARAAFLDTNGVFTTFAYPGSNYTEAYGINDAGQIVGSSVDSTGGLGFLDANRVSLPR